MTESQTTAVSTPAAAPEAVRTPVSRVESTETGYRLTLELPGADPESVDVRVEAGVLTITAERPRTEREGWQPLRREIPPGGWKQSFRLPSGLDTEAVEASLASGVLTLELARKAGRAIPIQAG